MYGDDPATQRLEKRIRRGDLVAKRYASLADTRIPGMDDDVPVFELDSADPVQLDFLAVARTKGLGPALVIRYNRSAFVDPIVGTRVTIDHQITAAPGCTGFYQPARGRYPCTPHGIAVLEIKTSGRLPWAVGSLLQGIHAERSAISKYMLGVETLSIRKERLWVPTSQFRMC